MDEMNKIKYNCTTYTATCQSNAGCIVNYNDNEPYIPPATGLTLLGQLSQLGQTPPGYYNMTNGQVMQFTSLSDQFNIRPPTFYSGQGTVSTTHGPCS